MLAYDEVFSNISMMWFIEYIYIRKSYTELKQFISKSGNLIRQDILNWITTGFPSEDIFTILNGLSTTENLCTVTSSMHVHLCKTVFKMVRLKICCLISMVQINVAVLYLVILSHIW